MLETNSRNKTIELIIMRSLLATNVLLMDSLWRYYTISHVFERLLSTGFDQRFIKNPFWCSGLSYSPFDCSDELLQSTLIISGSHFWFIGFSENDNISLNRAILLRFGRNRIEMNNGMIWTTTKTSDLLDKWAWDCMISR